MATCNECVGIAGPSLIGFPPPNRLDAHYGTGTDCWHNARCNAECCTPGGRVQNTNDCGRSRDCGSDDDWEWKQDEAGAQAGCIGDECYASRTCPPQNLVTGSPHALHHPRHLQQLRPPLVWRLLVVSTAACCARARSLSLARFSVVFRNEFSKRVPFSAAQNTQRPSLYIAGRYPPIPLLPTEHDYEPFQWVWLAT